MRHDQSIGTGPEGSWTGRLVDGHVAWTEGQLSLLGDTGGPVRPTDPGTSAEAAARPGRAGMRLRVLRALVLHAPASDEQLALVLGEGDRKDSVAKRRGELVDAGLAVHARDHLTRAHLYTTTRRGSRAIQWEATHAGRQEALEP